MGAAMMHEPDENNRLGADKDIAVDICLNPDDNMVFIVYDRPFSKDLSWLELDLDSSTLDFIMEDGDIRNFGIPVEPLYIKHMQNAAFLELVERNGVEFIQGMELPLIIHSE